MKVVIVLVAVGLVLLHWLQYLERNQLVMIIDDVVEAKRLTRSYLSDAAVIVINGSSSGSDSGAVTVAAVVATSGEKNISDAST